MNLSRRAVASLLHIRLCNRLRMDLNIWYKSLSITFVFSFSPVFNYFLGPPFVNLWMFLLKGGKRGKKMARSPKKCKQGKFILSYREVYWTWLNVKKKKKKKSFFFSLLMMQGLWMFWNRPMHVLRTGIWTPHPSKESLQCSFKESPILYCLSLILKPHCGTFQAISRYVTRATELDTDAVFAGFTHTHHALQVQLSSHFWHF